MPDVGAGAEVRQSTCLPLLRNTDEWPTFQGEKQKAQVGRASCAGDFAPLDLSQA